MKIGFIILFGGVCLIGIASFGCRRDIELSQRPPRVLGAKPIQPEESTIQTEVFIPYSVLSDAINRSAPMEVHTSGREPVEFNVSEQVKKIIGGDIGNLFRDIIKIVTVNRTIKGDVDHKETIRRDGAITIAPNNGKVRIAVPLSVSGQAGFAGDLSEAVGLDRKNFTGSIVGFADCSFGITPNWCPEISVTPDFDWRDNARLEVVSKVWIDVKRFAEGPLKDEMKKNAEKLPSLMGCDRIKQSLQEGWRNYSFPITNLPGSHIAVNISPTKIGLSKLEYLPDSIHFAFLLGAKAEVEMTSNLKSPQNLPLPPLTPISPNSSAFRFSLPIRLDYQEIQTALSNAVGRMSFTNDTPAGQVIVKVDGAECFPTEQNRLAIGVRFQADFAKSRSLSTKGTIFLFGEPVFDSNTQLFKVKNVAFSRILDNKLWALLSVVFEKQIKEEIEKKAVADLKPSIQKARTAIREAGGATESRMVKLDLNDNYLGLRQINLADQSIEVVVGFEGNAKLTLAKVK